MLKQIFQNLINHDNKVGFLLIYFFLFNINPLFSKCNFDFCLENKISFNKENVYRLKKTREKKLSNKKLKIFTKNLFGLGSKEIIQLNKLFSSILLTQNVEQSTNSRTNFSYEIEADSQYIENDIYYAEGNVIISLDNGELIADKIAYDSRNRLFKAFKNIVFKKGNQYFKSTYLEYDFINYKGFIDNVFGVLDTNTINKDLNFNKNFLTKNSCLQKDISLVDNPAEIGLLSSDNKRFNNDLKNNIKLNFSEVKKWKFRTKKIILDKDKWNSDMIDFSNDPFNKTQFIIRSKNLVGEIIENDINLTSKSTSIKFDNKFTLPIGTKTLSKADVDKEKQLLQWGFGYQNDYRDGFYVLRNFETLKYKDKLSLDLKPYFLLQRAIQGESDSFRAEDSEVTSRKVVKKTDFLDYFALNSILKGNFFNWNLNINSDLKTFNYQNFYDAFSFELNLLKNIYSHSNYISNAKDNICEINNNFNYFEDKSLDFGIYSLFEKEDIYSAYGGKLISQYKFKSKQLLKDYKFILDIGEYQGKGLNNNIDLFSLSRYGANITLNNDIKLTNFIDNNLIYNSSFKYTSIIPNQGLFLKTKIAYGWYEYSNSESQNIYSISFGPSFIYGNLKNKLFDYTEVSLLPEFISKNGSSPFKFDDFNNDSRIKFLVKQQLIGPFIMGFEGEYNINADSSNYGDVFNRKFFGEISRRAYSLKLIFDEDDKMVFLGFEIFDFNNIKFNKEFR